MERNPTHTNANRTKSVTNIEYTIDNINQNCFFNDHVIFDTHPIFCQPNQFSFSYMLDKSVFVFIYSIEKNTHTNVTPCMLCSLTFFRLFRSQIFPKTGI